MASIIQHGYTNDGELYIATYIDYSIVDGRVREFEMEGIKYFDEDDGTADPFWEEILWEWVKLNGRDKDDGIGLSAFVYPMIEKFADRKPN